MEIKISNNLNSNNNEKPIIKISTNLENVLNRDNLEIYSEEWLKFKTFIQRDSNDEYKIDSIYNSITGKKMLKLINIKNKIQITKQEEDFINILKMENGAWNTKE